MISITLKIVGYSAKLHLLFTCIDNKNNLMILFFVERKRVQNIHDQIVDKEKYSILFILSETTCHISHITSALSNSRMEKNGVTARYGHLSHIYFYFTPLL